jgi:hypothetical protein
MFYCYFSNKLVVYECIILYLLWFVRFCKIVFVCKLLKLYGTTEVHVLF